MPPEDTLLLKRGWLTEEVVAMYVNCRECKDKEVQTHENQRQEYDKSERKLCIKEREDIFDVKRRRK